MGCALLHLRQHRYLSISSLAPCVVLLLFCSEKREQSWNEHELDMLRQIGSFYLELGWSRATLCFLSGALQVGCVTETGALG